MRYRIQKFKYVSIITHKTMYIRNKKIGNKNYYIIEDRIKENDKYITKNIRYLGSAQKLLENLKELDKHREQKSLT